MGQAPKDSPAAPRALLAGDAELRLVECTVCGPLGVADGGGATAARNHMETTGHVTVATWQSRANQENP